MGILRALVLLGFLAALAFALYSYGKLAAVADGRNPAIFSPAAAPASAPKARPSGPGVMIDKKTGKRYETPGRKG